ncbi:SseB family protein [uncultured Acinetobacter sp.]|uniref:SseB family protein n=1 Tax=uncultured Acinetobacter sp. TaxID=165433 RepID=UPI0025DA23F4|nr:SseB family protein [uncultured Acinetobacter sp.]
MSNLEQLFIDTQKNYELIPDFIEKLLISDVYCLASQGHHKRVEFRVLETPEGDSAIPFFLSLEIIQNDIGVDAEYIVINTRQFFEMTQGATLVLNPTSELSKEFQPEEIKAILEIESDQAH